MRDIHAERKQCFCCRQCGLHGDPEIQRCADPATATASGAAAEAEAACLPCASGTHVRVQLLMLSSTSLKCLPSCGAAVTDLCRIRPAHAPTAPKKASATKKPPATQPASVPKRLPAAKPFKRAPQASADCHARCEGSHAALTRGVPAQGRPQCKHGVVTLTSAMLGCRLTAEQMFAISDADLVDQCKRALSARDHATPSQINTHVAVVSRQRAESPRDAAAPAALTQDDKATQPIDPQELSPRLRSFIGHKHRDKPAMPANRQMLEAWRAGEADVSPSKTAAGGPLDLVASGSKQSAAVGGVPPDDATACEHPQSSAPAVAVIPSGTMQSAAPVASPHGASAQHLDSQSVPRRPTLLQALLKGL